MRRPARKNPLPESVDTNDLLFGAGSLLLTAFGVYLIVKSQSGQAPDAFTTAGDTATLASLTTLVV